MSFENVAITVTYKTQFGEEMYMTGSEGLLGSWVPDNGIKLEWSEGHRWFKKLDMRELKAMPSFEFKFVVRNHGSNYTNWEGGANHKFDMAHVQEQLSDFNVKQHLRNLRPSDERFFIGSFQSQGPLKIAGTHDERYMKDLSKTNLYFTPATRTIEFY